MFDEFVEHVGVTPTAAGAMTATSTRTSEYQTFDSNPYAQEDLALEDAQLDSALTEPAPLPVFDIGRVQFEIPAPLVSMAVASDFLALALANNLLIFIELSRPEQVVKIPLPRKPQDMSIYKVFLDPSGRHALVTTLQGENWHFCKGWKKVKPLKTPSRITIESVAWNRSALLSSNATSTHEFLVGGRNGTIYEAVLDAEDDFFFKGQERYFQPVFSLPERQSITGMQFFHFPTGEGKKTLVIVTTPYRIYQFIGDGSRDDSGRPFTALFSRYKDTPPKIDELAGSMEHSELCFYTPHASQAQSLPTAVAWMTSPGVYHGTMNYSSNSDGFIDNASLIPYPSRSPPSGGTSSPPDLPLSTALTEFHFVVLYQDRVMAVSNLNEQVAFEESLPLRAGETARGLAVDPVRGTYWIYTDSSLLELSAGNEDRDVWRIYLTKGLHDAALRYAKTAQQKDQILVSQARAHFDEGKYFPAAQCYARSSANFEEVALAFLDAGERDALRSYLIARLEHTQKSDVTQRIMLVTWLVEFYLSKCNELDDVVASESVSHDVENFQVERKIIEEDLKQFFETYKASLDRETVYGLIQSHGRTDFYLHYATIIGDFERVIDHWILEGQWINAIDSLSHQGDLELYYRFAPILMRRVPVETVDCWIRQPSLDPLRLVPALLRLTELSNQGLFSEQAVRFLTHTVFERQHTSPILHNLLIAFYANPAPTPSLTHDMEDEGPLIRFLSTAPSNPMDGKPYYDLDYALRVCKTAGRTRACVLIYSKMGLWENSVDLALSKGDLELAQLNANMPEEDQPLRKKLWLKIAKYVVQDRKDIKSAMRFLESADLLKIEDVLPFFPDFVVIDDFKEEICSALEGYSVHIDDLRRQMDEATGSAEAIKQDIAGLKNRFVIIQAGERCSVCDQAVLTRQFYVFPCSHTFHMDCLITLIKQYLPSHALRRLVGLQTELLKHSQKVDKNAVLASNPGAAIVAEANPIPLKQRTLLSSNFTNLTSSARAAEALGKNLISAGDKLRDLIIPDVLSTVIASPNWSVIPGIGGGVTNAAETNEALAKKAERLRNELDALLASNCPLCESVVVALDKPFVAEGDPAWDL